MADLREQPQVAGFRILNSLRVAPIVDDTQLVWAIVATNESS